MRGGEGRGRVFCGFFRGIGGCVFGGGSEEDGEILLGGVGGGEGLFLGGGRRLRGFLVWVLFLGGKGDGNGMGCWGAVSVLGKVWVCDRDRYGELI